MPCEYCKLKTQRNFKQVETPLTGGLTGRCVEVMVAPALDTLCSSLGAARLRASLVPFACQESEAQSLRRQSPERRLTLTPSRVRGLRMKFLILRADTELLLFTYFALFSILLSFSLAVTFWAHATGLWHFHHFLWPPGWPCPRPPGRTVAAAWGPPFLPAVSCLENLPQALLGNSIPQILKCLQLLFSE